MPNQTQMNLSDVTAAVDLLRRNASAMDAPPEPMLKELAARTLASERTLRGRVTQTRFTEILARTLTTRFLLQEREVDEQQVARMISSAIRFQRLSIKDQTHYLPVHLNTVQADETIELGPVIFHPLTAFAATDDAPEETKEWIGQADLIAEVPVPKCEPGMSRIRATQAVSRATDLVRFLTAEAGITPPTNGMTPLPAWQDVLAILPTSLLDIAGNCLRCLIEADAEWPLAERFLDAIGWYAMAAREPADAAAITLWVNALERLTMTRDHERITDCVARRTTLLLMCAEQTLTYEAGRAEADDLYAVRCGLVHGAIRPFAEVLPAERLNAEKITRQTLLGALKFFDDIGLDERGITAKRLEKAFDAMEKRLQPR